MAKQKVMYVFNDDTKWRKILGDVTGLLGHPDVVDEIVVIATGTAVLSLLKSTILEQHKARIHDLTTRGITFYVCNGTLRKYGITPDVLLPDIKVAENGSDIKVLELTKLGFVLFALPYI